MSQSSFNPFDPTGMFKELRDSNMEAWSKMMLELVNTKAYADATGAMLDAWLASSEPLRKVMEKAVGQTLSALQLPAKEDVIGLAQRLANIEMRLDDLQAKLDESLPAARNG